MIPGSYARAKHRNAKYLIAEVKLDKAKVIEAHRDKLAEDGRRLWCS